MKISIKANYNQENHEGIPIYIVGSHLGKRKRKLLFRIAKSNWDNSKLKVKKTLQYFGEYNRKINDELHFYKSKAINCDDLNVIFQSKDIKETYKASIQDLLIEYAHNRASIGRLYSYRSYNPIVSKLNEYYKKPMPLSDFSKNEIEGFHKFISKEISNNTASKNIQRIKTAIRYGNERKFDVNLSALDYVVSINKTPKIKLTEDEFKRITELNLAGNLDLARDVFVFQVYMRGIRVRNALTAKYDGSEYYKQNDVKTGKINKIKYRPEVLDIIKKYSGGQYIFPCVKKQNDIGTWTTIINYQLKIIAGLANIDKSISSHTARHTFASMAEKKGIDIRIIKEMLNHSSVSQTETYLNDLRQDDILDDATDRVFG